MINCNNYLVEYWASRNSTLIRLIMCLSLPCSAITLSVPGTASVAEESGSVQVCASLSDVPAGGTVAINIMLATIAGKIVCSSMCSI